MHLLLLQKLRNKHVKLFNIHSLSTANTNILFPVSILMLTSMLLLYSAGDGIGPWMWKQGIYNAIFFCCAAIITCINSDTLFKFAYLAYFSTIGLLCLVLVIGQVSMGAKRWINLRFIHLQPSEFAKVGLILVLAKVFQTMRFRDKILDPNLLIPLIFISLPIGLTAIQPDLATSITMLMIGCTVCFACGVRIAIFMIGAISIIASMPLVWHNLHEYQKLRVLNFLNPGRDPLGSGYSVIQSQIAVGSGGLFGKGLLKGNQAHLNFLPEHQTDFIFTMLSEEFGFIGCLIAIACYISIIKYGATVAIKANSMFCKTIAIGSSIMFFFHWFINAGMITGILPVAGIPMPLLSYGGSSIATSMICIGLMMHADANANKEYY